MRVKLARIFLFALAFMLVGCQQSPPAPKEAVNKVELPAGTTETAPMKRHISRGQLVYVPCYSHVYLRDGEPYNLAITLSVRNTSQTEKLVIQSVSYYNSAGKLVKEHAEKEVVLGPLATAEYFVSEDDKSGGSGANFLVKWVAEGKVEDPIIEAVMCGTAGAQGVSFLTTGRVLRDL